MDNISILNKIRDLKILVLNPDSETTDSLVLQLTRIGCSVRCLWPLPKKLDFDVDVIFHGVFQDSCHAQLKNLVSSCGDEVTLISIIEYESPTVLSQILDIGSHGVILLPLISHNVFPQLVMARKNSHEIARRSKDVNKLNQKISSMSRINKAKIKIMARFGLTEEEAHKYLSRIAMETRKSLVEVSEQILVD